MVFSSIFFVFRFVVLFFALYYIMPYKYKNLVITVFSLIFYSWGEFRYFPIMLATILINYICSLIIEKKRESKAVANVSLAVAAVFSLGMLFFFKYADFFIRNINSFTGLKIGTIGLSLPLGISFYTFQTLSYTIDVWRNKTAAEKNIINFAAFVTMFPQLIAGPIVKYTDISDKLNTYKGRYNLQGINEGIKLFVFGLAKKVLISNNVGMLWDDVQAIGFANVSTPLAWLGIVAYALHIYFDFSGYSLMAIGMGKMMGFDFPDNFNLPYISKSITEFWRRWHMTLGGWFREYVYIPLGGNRKGMARQIFNMFVVWFLTGFWHGAEWNFMFWGLYYFALLVLEKTFLLKFLEKHPVFARFYTLFAVVIGWAIFAVTDLSRLGLFFTKLFSFTGGVSVAYYIKNYGISLVIAILCSTSLTTKIYEKIKDNDAVIIPVVIALFVICTAYMVDSTYNPFIYFRF
ncbi:MAG: MBOAT family protein [Oscillospiraceae bacterium]|nr:MBOAT family protein [Oscillospiraceae bacterium]